VSPYRLWYNDWVLKNATGKVLDVGKSQYWDYGFQTIDINPTLEPTFTGNIEDTNFPKNMFDTVLCNGMYECVDSPKKMIDECLRITKQGGKVIFGFVGKDYKPYKKDWKFYEGKEYIASTKETKDFNNEYHFIICQK
jgi:ubiquinone/menaquinone biosynthesis C-methylase UbiE